MSFNVVSYVCIQTVIRVIVLDVLINRLSEQWRYNFPSEKARWWKARIVSVCRRAVCKALAPKGREHFPSLGKMRLPWQWIVHGQSTDRHSLVAPRVERAAGRRVAHHRWRHLALCDGLLRQSRVLLHGRVGAQRQGLHADTDQRLTYRRNAKGKLQHDIMRAHAEGKVSTVKKITGNQQLQRILCLKAHTLILDSL